MRRVGVILALALILVISAWTQNVVSLGSGLLLSRDIKFFDDLEDGDISDWQIQTSPPGNWVILNDPPPNGKGSFGYPSAWSLWVLSRPDPGGGFAFALSPAFAFLPPGSDYLVAFDVFLTDLGGSGFILGDDGAFRLTLDNGFDLYGHGTGAPVLLATMAPSKWYRVEVRARLAADARYEVLVNGTYLGEVDLTDGIPVGQRLKIGDDDVSAMTWGEAFFDNIVVAALRPTPWIEGFEDGEAGDWTRVEASCSDLVEVTGNPSGQVLHMWFNTSLRCLNDGPSIARTYSPYTNLVRNWSFELRFRFAVLSPDSSWFTVVDFRYGRIVVTNDTQVALWWPLSPGAAAPGTTAFLATLTPGQWYEFRVFVAPWMPLAMVYIEGLPTVTAFPVAFESPWIEHGGVWVGGNSSSTNPIAEIAHAEALWDDFVLSLDSDGDGLSDWEELTPGFDGYVTDPGNPDTDGDLLIDGLEVGVEWLDADPGNLTSPADADSDDDGRWDGNEDFDKNGRRDVFMGIRETDPSVRDTDSDGLTDGQEVGLAWPDGYSSYSEWTSDPNSDTRAGPTGFAPDGDGGQSTTDAIQNDTDGDQLPDGWVDGWDGLPSNGERDPGEFEDSDLDGVVDTGVWLPTGGAGETDPTVVDSDSDDLLDANEINLATNPILADTDGDGILDAWEVDHSLDPKNFDSDGRYDSDAWTNIQEYVAGTDPWNSDTDTDFLRDDSDPNPLDFNIRARSGDILPNTDLVDSQDFLYNGMTFRIAYAFDFVAPPLQPVEVDIVESTSPAINLRGQLVRFKITLSYPLSFSAAIKVRYAESSLVPGMEENDLLVYYYWGGGLWTLGKHPQIQEDTWREPDYDYVWISTRRVGEFAVADSTENDIDGDHESDGEELNVAEYDPEIREFCDAPSDTSPCYTSRILSFGDGGDVTLYIPIHLEDGAYEFARSESGYPGDGPRLVLDFALGVAQTPFLEYVRDMYDFPVPVGSATFEAQSFTSPIDVRLGALELRLSREGSPSGPLTISLRSDASGHPDMASYLGSVSTTVPSVNPGSEWIRVYGGLFGLALSQSTVYWIELECATCSSGDIPPRYLWIMDTQDGYSGGVPLITNDEGANWDSYPFPADFFFRLFESDYPSSIEVNIKRSSGDTSTNWRDTGGRAFEVTLTDSNPCDGCPTISEDVTAFLGAYQSYCDGGDCTAFEGNVYVPVVFHSATPGTVAIESFYLYADALPPSQATETDDDMDGLSTDVENLYFGTDPYPPSGWDTDGDLLSDGQEVREYGTLPTSRYTDGDLLDDYEEVVLYHTDPWNPDSDSDGLSDDVEVAGGSDPWNPDTDEDGWRDDVDPDPLQDNPLEWWGVTWHFGGRRASPRDNPSKSNNWWVDTKFQSIWENYLRPTHLRLLRNDVDIMSSVTCDPDCALTTAGTERVLSLRNLAVWASENDAYLLPILGGVGHWPCSWIILADQPYFPTITCEPDDTASLDTQYIQRVGLFVEELANAFIAGSNADAYRRIVAYQVENEMNHPSHHGDWTSERQRNLLAGGSESIRQAEERAGVQAIRGGFTPLMFNPSYDWMVFAHDHYNTLKWQVESVLGDPRSKFDVVAFDYYPHTWTPFVDRLDIVTVTKQLVADFGLGSSWGKRIAVAEAGWSTEDGGPGSQYYLDQRDYYSDLTGELKQYYWQEGGRSGGFVGVLWYALFDMARSDRQNLHDDNAGWPTSTEWNFGIFESPKGMSSAGGYNEGEVPKDVWYWLKDEMTP